MMIHMLPIVNVAFFEDFAMRKILNHECTRMDANGGRLNMDRHDGKDTGGAARLGEAFFGVRDREQAQLRP